MKKENIDETKPNKYVKANFLNIRAKEMYTKEQLDKKFEEGKAQQKKKDIEIIDKEMLFWEGADCNEERKRTSRQILKDIRKQLESK